MLLLALVAPALSAADPPSLLVTVTSTGSVTAVPVEGHLVWQPTGREGADGPVVVAVHGTGRYRLPAAERGAGILTARVAGYWAPDQVLAAGGEVGAAMTEAHVALVPTGTLEGGVEVPRGQRSPDSLELRFGPASLVEARASASGASRSGSVECPVDGEGQWRCELPEGLHDLRWHASGFASVLRWQVPVASGETARVEDLSLVPGAAILGFVATTPAVGSDRKAPSSAPSTTPRVTVQLDPAGPQPLQHDARRRLGFLRQRQLVGPDGSFQFTGLAAGTYRITATAEGMAQAERTQVDVLEGRESRLVEPIRLQPLAVQEVRVVPPSSPGDKPWIVSLHRPGSALDLAPCRTDVQGWCRLVDVPSGEFFLRVEDAPGSKWREEWVNVAPDGLPLEVELPVVPIEGRIALGGEPARARLVLRHDDGGAAVELFSDAEGDFHGHLPGEGTWSISATFRARGAESALGTHDIVRPDDGGPAWLELELPDTILRGRVVGPNGQGVSHAVVAVLPRPSAAEGGANRARSDEDGWFWFWGLPEGGYVARATGRHAAATSEEFQLREGEEGDVLVQLKGSRKLRGRVLGLVGPIAGAEVHLVPAVPLAEMPGIQRLVTGPGGLFEGKIPSGATAVTATVLAPGQAARIVRLPLAAGSDPEIDVQPLGGTLLLRDETGPIMAGSRIEHDGAWTWLGTLLAWPALHGQPARFGTHHLSLPMMEPGRYRFCSADLGRCREGQLAPGGLLELVIQSNGARPLKGAT